MDKEEFTQSSIRSIAWVKLIQSAMLDQDFINIHIQIHTNFQTSMDTNIQKSIHDKQKLLGLLYQKMKMFIMQVRKYISSNMRCILSCQAPGARRMGVRSITRCCMDVLVPHTGTA